MRRYTLQIDAVGGTMYSNAFPCKWLAHLYLSILAIYLQANIEDIKGNTALTSKEDKSILAYIKIERV